MYYVSVKHPGNDKRYIFSVPPKLVPYVHSGRDAVCSTRRGPRFANILTEPAEIDEEDAASMAYLTELGAVFPMNQITGVRFSIPREGIKIYAGMRNKIPDKKKLIRRLDEYFSDGYFHTAVSFDDKGFLVDGYTAWLFAKMFNLEEIPIQIDA